MTEKQKSKDLDFKQIAQALGKELEQSLGPKVPKWLERCNEEYVATASHYSDEGLFHIRSYRVMARIVRHYTLKISDSAVVSILAEDTRDHNDPELVKEGGTRTDYSGLGCLGEYSFDLNDPDSIPQMVQYIKALEFTASKADKRIENLVRENADLKDKLYRRRLDLLYDD